MYYIHHGGYLHEQKPELRQLALQGRVTLMVLSDHVGWQLKDNLLKWALFEKEVAWDRIGIETMVPILPVKVHAFSEPHKNPRPSKAVIQGGINKFRRDYEGAYRDLLAEVQKDLALWGMEWDERSANLSKCVRRGDDTYPSFELHIIGQGENIPVPIETLCFTLRATPTTQRLLLSLRLSSRGFQCSRQSRSPGDIHTCPPAVIPHPVSWNALEAIAILRQGGHPIEQAQRRYHARPDAGSWKAYEYAIAETNK